jgi:hypothetical protein
MDNSWGTSETEVDVTLISLQILEVRLRTQRTIPRLSKHQITTTLPSTNLRKSQNLIGYSAVCRTLTSWRWQKLRREIRPWDYLNCRRRRERLIASFTPRHYLILRCARELSWVQARPILTCKNHTSDSSKTSTLKGVIAWGKGLTRHYNCVKALITMIWKISKI